MPQATPTGPNGYPVIQGIELIPTARLPDRIQSVFKYPLLNPVQSKCFPIIYESSDNFVVSAPTGSGKTAILELAICRLLATSQPHECKIIYQAPTKSLCTERQRDWSTRFRQLDITVVELTGDSEMFQLKNIATADIIITVGPREILLTEHVLTRPPAYRHQRSGTRLRGSGKTIRNSWSFLSCS
jgi:ATP-dependent DNA helicase HFM1/MER3